MNKKHILRKTAKVKTLTLLFACVAVAAICTVLSKGAFIKPLNLRNIMVAMVITSLLAIGEAFLIKFGDIDLSAGAVGTFSSLIMGNVLVTFGMPWYLALLAALVTGALCGMLNAFLVNELNFQPFIATLAIASMAEGMGYIISGATAIKIQDPVLKFIGTKRIFGNVVPVSFLIVLVLVVIYGIVMGKTHFGRVVSLCGGNREASRLAGVNPKKISYMLYANMGMLAAVAGCMQAFRLESAKPSGIINNGFAGITAAILGGVSFGGGKGGIFGCFFGILLICCFNNGLTILQVSNHLQTMASGALLLMALFIDYLAERRRNISRL